MKETDAGDGGFSIRGQSGDGAETGGPDKEDVQGANSELDGADNQGGGKDIEDLLVDN